MCCLLLASHALHGDPATRATTCQRHHHQQIHQCIHAACAAPSPAPQRRRRPAPPGSRTCEPAARRRSRPGELARCQAAAAGGAAAGTAVDGGAQLLGWSRGFTAKFRLGRVLGRGSFATVHEALHLATGSRFAVKVLRKGQRGTQLEAITREVDAWRQAQASQFVARLEGVYEDEEHAYIVQELCAGGDLKALLDSNGCLSEPEAAAVMRGVLDMLVECHQRSICFGDLKPANILFSQDQQGQQEEPRAGRQPGLPAVRAVDFGCSRMSAKGRLLTHCCGSPLYSAPEMALQRFGVGVDVWAAGVMMYQMLTGRLPFWRKPLHEVSRLPPYEILAAVRTYEVQFPREQWASVSPLARDLVESMLDRNPATRITAEAALAHPWVAETLGYTPRPTGAARRNNVVDFAGGSARPAAQQQPQPQQQEQRQQQQQPGLGAAAPLPAAPLSPGRGGAHPGPLSPLRAGAQEPLRGWRSGELPAGALLPDSSRVQQLPAVVPAAE